MWHTGCFQISLNCLEQFCALHFLAAACVDCKALLATQAIASWLGSCIYPQGVQLGPLQSFGWWFTAIKAAQGVDCDELLCDVSFLYTGALRHDRYSFHIFYIVKVFIQRWNFYSAWNPNQFV